MRDNNTKTNNLAYKISQIIALVMCVCASAIMIALTIKFIMWIF